MKIRVFACILILIVLLTGCSSDKLETADKLEFKYKYARLLPFGIQLELGDAYVVTQATNFTSKYMAVLYNRNYRTVSGDEEKIYYSEHYTEKHGDLKNYYENLKNFYTQYKVSTELARTEVHHIIMMGDDAYVDLTAYVTLQECVSSDIARKIGFSGIAGTQSQEYRLKIQSTGKEYKLYDLERVNGEKSLSDFALLADKFDVPEIFETIDIVDNTELYAEEAKDEITAENNPVTASGASKPESKKENTSKDAENEQKLSEVRDFINNLAEKQNNRSYKTLEGNEDYPFLSDAYIAVLNKKRNDVEYTKQVYNEKQLSTELVSVNIKSIDVRKNAYIVNFDVVSRITECVSDEEAKRIGYTGGIGSTGTMSFVYTVSEIDGQLKLVNSKQTK